MQLDINEKIKQAENAISDIGINYVGCKRKILPWLYKELNSRNIINDKKYFIDAFGGSGVVSLFFAKMGSKGYINDLMISSHIAHCAMFYSEKMSIDKDLTEDPPFVYFKENILDTLDQNKGQKAKEKFKRKSLLSKYQEKNKVSVDIKFDSDNSIFNSYWFMIKPYILKYFTAKEAFDVCKILTNITIFGAEVEYEKHFVKCFQGDVNNFLEDSPWIKDNINKDDLFIYLDPPYGGWNSNYHQIYSVIECISYAFKKISKAFKDNAKNGIEYAIKLEDKRYGPYPSAVADLHHIMLYGDKLNTKNAASTADHRYYDNFEKLLKKCYETQIKYVVLSFNSDSSWASEDQIKNKLDEFFSNIEICKIPYNYSYRYKSSEAKSMGTKLIGKDNIDIVQKEGTSEEILFICKNGV